MAHEKLAELRGALLHRFDRLVATAVEGLLAENWIARTAARIGWWWHRKGITGKAVTMIKDDLEKNEQLAAALPGTSVAQPYPWLRPLLIVLAVIAVCLFLYNR